MNVGLWAEIRRLSEIEKLSQRGIARQLGCSRELVKRALALDDPPHQRLRLARPSILDPYKPRIDAIIARYPKLSAVRVHQQISTVQSGVSGYTGSVSLVREYLRAVRPVHVVPATPARATSNSVLARAVPTARRPA